MRFTVKSTTTLILASKSPRRIELMTLAGFDFLSVPAVKEEKITGGTSPSQKKRTNPLQRICVLS